MMKHNRINYITIISVIVAIFCISYTISNNIFSKKAMNNQINQVKESYKDLEESYKKLYDTDLDLTQKVDDLEKSVDFQMERNENILKIINDNGYILNEDERKLEKK